MLLPAGELLQVLAIASFLWPTGWGNLHPHLRNVLFTGLGTRLRQDEFVACSITDRLHLCINSGRKLDSNLHNHFRKVLIRSGVVGVQKTTF